MRRLIFHSGTISVLALALNACSVLPDPAPADTIYRLSPLTESVQAAQTATVIRVDRPVASVVFQSRDIVVSPDGLRLASAAQAKWIETMPSLIQSAFVDVLATRPNLVGVIPASGARTNQRVQLTIKNFEAQFDNGTDAAPLAVIRYSVTYANSSNRALLGTYDVKAVKRAKSTNVANIVEAISIANNEALMDVAKWVESQAATPKPKS